MAWRTPLRRHRDFRLAGNHDRYCRRAHPAHQARHRRGQRLVPLSAVGGGAHRAARPSDARARDARPRSGSLPTDGSMIGLQQSQTRGLLEDGLGIITSCSPATNLSRSRRSLGPARRAVAFAAVFQSAVRCRRRRRCLADRRQACRAVWSRLSSGGATMAAGFDALALHWDVLYGGGQAAQQDRRSQQMAPGGLVPGGRDEGASVSRRGYGIEHWFRYFQPVAAFPQMSVPATRSAR